MDVIDKSQKNSGSSSNPFVLDNNLSETSCSSHQENLLDVVTVHSDPSSPDTYSSSSIDESLTIAIDNYNVNTELDNKLFMAELYNFINCYKTANS